MGTHFRNASWSGVAAAVRAAAGLLSALLAVRLLGVNHYGHVATWLSLFVLYLSLNSSVFTMLVVKLLEPATAVQRWHKDDVAAAAVIFCLGSLALLAGATTLLATFITNQPAGDGTPPAGFGKAVVLMGLLTAIQVVAALQAAVLEGAGRLDAATKSQLAGPLTIVGALSWNFFSGAALNPEGYVALLCAGPLVDMGILWVVRSALGHSLSIPAYPWRLSGVLQLLRSGSVLQATSLLTLFLEPANKFLLNRFAGAAPVAVYDLAMKVIWGIQYLFGAVMRVFLHIGSQDHGGVGKAFAKAVVWLGVPAVVLHTAGALFLFWAAHHWLAVDASSLMTFFGIAAISNIGMIFAMPLYLSLIGRRELRFILRTQALLAVINVFVSGLLIPFVGLVGSAIGLLVATLLNVSAIYTHCQIRVSDFDAEGDAIARAKPRMALAVSLLAATVVWGAVGSENPYVLASIIVGLAAIAAGEPLMARLINQFIPKRP